MSIMINQDKCVGCKKCTNVCPGDLIRISENTKAYNAFPTECWGCASCIKECRNGAISFYLGADIGGQGHKMYVQQKGDIIDWIFKDALGRESSITINKKESNKY